MKFMTADCVCFEETGGWVFNGRLGILYQYNELTNRISSFYALPNGTVRCPIQMSVYKKKVYLFPYWERTLMIFDTEREIFYETEIKGSKASPLYARYAGRHNDCIYLYLVNECVIVEINVVNMQQKRFVLPEKYLHKISSNATVCTDTDLLFPVIDKNIVLAFDLDRKTAREITIHGFSGGVCTIADDGGCYWITGTDKTYVKWDHRTEEIVGRWDLPDNLEVYDSRTERWENFKNVCSDGVFPFLSSMIMQDWIYFFPYLSNMILQVDVRSGQYKELVFSKEDKKYVPRMKVCEFMAADYNRHVIALQTPGKISYVIDSAFTGLQEKNYGSEKDFYNRFLSGRIAAETDGISMEELFMSADAAEGSAVIDRDRKSGKLIYQYMVDMIYGENY